MGAERVGANWVVQLDHNNKPPRRCMHLLHSRTFIPLSLPFLKMTDNVAIVRRNVIGNTRVARPSEREIFPTNLTAKRYRSTFFFFIKTSRKIID